MGKLSLTGYRTRGRLADLSTVAAFNPVTAIGWAHLYYAGGPAFQALGLTNGNTITSWPDEIIANAADLNNGSSQYRSADSQFNSMPSAAGLIANGNTHSTTVAVGKQVAVPFSVICIFQCNSTTSTQYFYDGANAGNTGNRIRFRIAGGPSWALQMGGTEQSGGTVTTGIKASRVLATSGNDTLTINGSTILSGVNAGDQTWQGLLILGENPGATVDGRMAFWGIYAGDITAHGSWAAFQSWVSSTYGVSIS